MQSQLVPSQGRPAGRTFSTLFAATVGLASAFGTACQPVEPEPAVDLAQLAPGVDPAPYGALIAQHPRFPVLVQRVNARIQAHVQRIASQPLTQTLADIATFESCQQAGDIVPCVPRLLAYGWTETGASADHADVQQIASDVGLAQTTPEKATAAFRAAVFARNGAGENSVLVPIMTTTTFQDAPGFVCDAACQESFGHSIGMMEASYLRALYGGGTTPVARVSGGADVAPVIPAVVAAAVIAGAVTLTIAIENWIWNSDETNKECHHDSDCPDDEFCHKTGSNDCRPAHGQGHLCTRDAQCESDCCKVFWGAPVCRPADRCD